MVARLSQITMSPACQTWPKWCCGLRASSASSSSSASLSARSSPTMRSRPVGIEIERLAAGVGMGAHQRMLDVGRLGDLLRRARRGPVAGARRVVAVDGAQAVDASARGVGQRLVDRVHVAEPGRAAVARDLDAVQQRRLGRAPRSRNRRCASPRRGSPSCRSCRRPSSVLTMIDTSGHVAAVLVAQQLRARLPNASAKRSASAAAPCARPG